jgi:F0F1-type ATP synthase assembly protein I
MTAHHRLDTVVDRPVPTIPDQVEVVAVSDKSSGRSSSDRSAPAMFGALTGIATLSAALVVGGAGLGLLADDATGAPHVFVFLGLVLGIVAAVLATRSIIGRFFR